MNLQLRRGIRREKERKKEWAGRRKKRKERKRTGRDKEKRKLNIGGGGSGQSLRRKRIKKEVFIYFLYWTLSCMIRARFFLSCVTHLLKTSQGDDNASGRTTIRGFSLSETEFVCLRFRWTCWNANTRPTLWQLWSFKIRPTKFLNHIKGADFPICWIVKGPVG